MDRGLEVVYSIFLVDGIEKLRDYLKSSSLDPIFVRVYLQHILIEWVYESFMQF